MKINKAYKFRIYPNKIQKEIFEKEYKYLPEIISIECNNCFIQEKDKENGKYIVIWKLGLDYLYYKIRRKNKWIKLKENPDFIGLE